MRRESLVYLVGHQQSSKMLIWGFSYVVSDQIRHVVTFIALFSRTYLVRIRSIINTLARQSRVKNQAISSSQFLPLDGFAVKSFFVLFPTL